MLQCRELPEMTVCIEASEVMKNNLICYKYYSDLFQKRNQKKITVFFYLSLARGLILSSASSIFFRMSLSVMSPWVANV